MTDYTTMFEEINVIELFHKKQRRKRRFRIAVLVNLAIILTLIILL